MSAFNHVSGKPLRAIKAPYKPQGLRVNNAIRTIR
jgi:hypothetical protein